MSGLSWEQVVYGLGMLLIGLAQWWLSKKLDKNTAITSETHDAVNSRYTAMLTRVDAMQAVIDDLRKQLTITAQDRRDERAKL